MPTGNLGENEMSIPEGCQRSLINSGAGIPPGMLFFNNHAPVGVAMQRPPANSCDPFRDRRDDALAYASSFYCSLVIAVTSYGFLMPRRALSKDQIQAYQLIEKGFKPSLLSLLFSLLFCGDNYCVFCF